MTGSACLLRVDRLAAFAAGLFALLGLLCLTGCDEREVSVDETPIRILTETVGGGPMPERGEIACVAYEMRYPDGRMLMRDDETCFIVGEENVIAAIAETLEGMRTGGRREVVVPPHKHWGREGYGPIEPGTTLHLELELLAVHPPNWRPNRPNRAN